MKDIVGNEVELGDIIAVTESRESSMELLIVTKVKPGSLKGYNLVYQATWEQGKRSSKGVVRFLPQQKAMLLKNPDYNKRYQ